MVPASPEIMQESGERERDFREIDVFFMYFHLLSAERDGEESSGGSFVLLYAAEILSLF